MTNPMRPNSRTIEDGDPTKIRVAGLLPMEVWFHRAGFDAGQQDYEMPPESLLNAEFMAGYFAGCDARRGITR